MTGAWVTDARRALGPVCEELSRRARAEADRIRSEGEEEARRTVEAAEARARELLDRARERGESEGGAARAAVTAGARRRALTTVLEARSGIREEWRDRVTAAVLRLREEPGYPDLRAALTARARDLLGADARVEEAPEGGIVARNGNRRLDLTLAAVASRVVEDDRGGAEEMWAP